MQSTPSSLMRYLLRIGSHRWLTATNATATNTTLTTTSTTVTANGLPITGVRQQSTSVPSNISAAVVEANEPIASGGSGADWDRAIANAEQLVGHQTVNYSLRSLLSDEVYNVALHLNKLVGTNHPLLETAKRLTYTGHKHIQTRGLIVLLMSKAAGHPLTSIDYIDAQQLAGISGRQRSLAEMTEMIYSAHLIHRGILNLQPSSLLLSQPQSQPTKTKDLHFGNKMSVLSGDFLLASVWKGLGELRDTKVVELMATAIGDFMEGQFVIETQSQFPTAQCGRDFWEERNFLRIGSLQANSCQSAVQLAGHSDSLQLRAYNLGRNIALGWQAFNELQPYIDSSVQQVNNSTMDLISAPVCLHIENNGQSLDEIVQNGSDNQSDYDYNKLHVLIRNGPAIDKTRQLIREYTDRALESLEGFPKCDATQALSNIVFAIRDQ
ncbi:all trans-polyprenyl-diphosphate synthase PDSS2-like [Oppia nitens]|uniref:all trans-polyprenyl-diphosphate synthase PDSS2-like n=1 Tax=Oppia nitens TaxID=1686743 RepID=UPI0023DA3331|nr:all trans-polyprenyl-diphosphate synthase PDSS2-like [Oppia nitens]